MASKFTLTGVDALERRMGEEVRDVHARAVVAVREEAETVLANTHPPIVSGKLDLTGHVENEDTNNLITSSIVYGGDEAPYAPYVHEMLGDGHKFLEHPFVESETNMLNRLTERIRK